MAIEWAKINWGSVADWVAGIGSMSAAIVALYVSSRTSAIKLGGYAGERALVGNGARDDIFFCSVTNQGIRPATVINFSLHCGRGKKRKSALIPYWGGGSTQFPKILNDGESAHWQMPIEQWLNDIVDNEFASSWLEIETFYVAVHTTTNYQLKLKLERPLRNKMHDRLTALRGRAP